MQASSLDITGGIGYHLNPLVTAIQIGNQALSKVAYNLETHFPSQGALSAELGITSTVASTATLVTAGPGHLIAISVIRAASAGTTGMIYDSAGTAVSSDVAGMVVIPSCVGYYAYTFPFNEGLVVLPSTASGQHTVSVSYRS